MRDRLRRLELALGPDLAAAVGVVFLDPPDGLGDVAAYRDGSLRRVPDGEALFQQQRAARNPVSCIRGVCPWTVCGLLPPYPWNTEGPGGQPPADGAIA
jgi:hypothetical protein